MSEPYNKWQTDSPEDYDGKTKEIGKNSYLKYFPLTNAQYGNYLYVFSDQYDNILYVGETYRLRERLTAHLGGRSGWTQDMIDRIAYVDYIDFATECDQKIYEIYLICYLQPPYNTLDKHELGDLRLPLPKKQRWQHYELYREQEDCE